MKKLVCYAACVLVIISGCALWKVKYSIETKGELIFSHKLHIEMEAECEICHTEAAENETASRNNFPEEEDCMLCHEREECSLCHLDVNNAIPLVPEPTAFIFSHKKHLTERDKTLRDRAAAINEVVPFVKPASLDKKIDCLTCHESVKESTIAAEKHMPDMKTCRGCHEISKEDCSLCHDNLGEQDFVPASHYFTWIRNHQQMVVAEGESLCENCHRGEVRSADNAVLGVTEEHIREEDTKVCADCHRGDIWPEGIHDNNGLQSHGIDAIANQNVCNSCHERAECLACHEQRGVSFAIHEDGWDFDHASKARRRLSSCTACHEEEDCLACHQQRFSPHSSDWDREMPEPDEVPCSKCHVE